MALQCAFPKSMMNHRHSPTVIFWEPDLPPELPGVVARRCLMSQVGSCVTNTSQATLSTIPSDHSLDDLVTTKTVVNHTKHSLYTPQGEAAPCVQVRLHATSSMFSNLTLSDGDGGGANVVQDQAQPSSASNQSASVELVRHQKRTSHADNCNMTFLSESDDEEMVLKRQAGLESVSSIYCDLRDIFSVRKRRKAFSSRFRARHDLETLDPQGKSQRKAFIRFVSRMLSRPLRTSKPLLESESCSEVTTNSEPLSRETYFRTSKMSETVARLEALLQSDCSALDERNFQLCLKVT